MGQKSGNGESRNTNRRVAHKYSTAPIYHFTPNLAYWRIDFLSFLLRRGGGGWKWLCYVTLGGGGVWPGVTGGGGSCLKQCSHRPTLMPKPGPPQARPTPPPYPSYHRPPPPSPSSPPHYPPPPPPLTGPGYAPGGWMHNVTPMAMSTAMPRSWLFCHHTMVI